jgi:hypothetical protein
MSAWHNLPEKHLLRTKVQSIRSSEDPIMPWKRTLLAAALIGAGLVAALAFDEYQASCESWASWLLTIIGVPYCTPQRSGPQHFELAVAQEDTLAYSEPPYWYYPTRQALGAALLVAGDMDCADEVLRARTPNNGWALFALTQVYKRRGDKSAAQAAGQLLDKAWMGDRRAFDVGELVRLVKGGMQ